MMTTTARVAPTPSAETASPKRRRLRRRLIAWGVVILLIVAAIGAWLATYLIPNGPRALYDDFDGPAGAAPDPAIWGYDLGASGWGNNELQEYTRDAVALDGEGNLVITATIPRDGSPITSGRPTTQGRFSFTHGTLEARMKLPGEQGLLPAFWLRGDTVDFVGWPASGEIDMIENPSSDSTSWYHVHGPITFTKKWSIGEAVKHDVPLTDDYHVWGVTRTPGRIDITMDGETVLTVEKDQLQQGKWVFDLPMHVLFSLAVGGNWPGGPDETTPEVAEMKIDWIRFTPAD